MVDRPDDLEPKGFCPFSFPACDGGANSLLMCSQCLTVYRVRRDRRERRERERDKRRR